MTIRSILLLALATGSANAQLGGLIKRAAGKAAAAKVEEKMPDDENAKPLGGQPLTADVLDGVLKGLSLEMEKKGEADKLTTIAMAKNDEFQKAREAGADEARAWNDRNNKINSCMYSALEKAKDKNQEVMTSKMLKLINDPNGAAFGKKYGETMQQMTVAMQKGDTIGMKRFEGQLYRLVGIDVAKDTAAAIAQCGKPSPMPASMVATNKLEAEKDALYDQLRKIEGDMSAGAAKAAGLSTKEYSLARERIWAWNAARKERHGSGGVSKEEDVLFKSRAADIQKVQNALR